MLNSTQFKWNPFSMYGDQPSSLRFFPDEGFEFATKEDLEAIKADPRLSRYYTAVQGGVTKKFQAHSDEKKELEKTIQSLQSQVAELDEALTKWETWREANEPLLNEFVESRGGGDPSKQRGNKGKGENLENNKVMEDRFNQIVDAVNKAGSKINGELSKMGKMVNFSLQLGRLHRQAIKEGREIDEDKILDVALKKGYTDLSKAYMDDDAYGKDVFEGKVRQGVDARFKEEADKRKTQVEPGSGSFPFKLEGIKPSTGSFEADGQAFLEERSKEAVK